MKMETDVPVKMCGPALPAIAADASPVQRFYTGASVLVTGGTGFLGKVLIEKLLWACPDVNAIYVLVRNKKGQTAQERIITLLSSECFDRLRLSRGPGFGSKLVAVQGDIADDHLGLSCSDIDLLSRHVSVVFHVAATIRFNEPLHVAVTQNARGTRELLALCRTCPEIKAVVHVSTAYSHCPLLDIEERFYDAPMDCDLAIKMAAAGELTPAMEDSLRGPWPNTYSFSKALAEEVVRRHGHGLPVCVFRPAIVIPSLSEPVEGWVDSMAGPASLLAGYLTGIIRVTPGDGKKEAALVPCDMVVDGMIAAAWDVAQKGVRRLYKKTDKMLDELLYFSKRQWNFEEKNVPALWNKLGPQDKTVFNFDMRTLDWNTYIKQTSPGIRKFILKEDPATIPVARERYKRVIQVKIIFWMLLSLIAVYAVMTI